MPSVSKRQAHLFAAVAHNPAFAKKVGIPQSVGRKFNQADKRTGILKKGGGGPASMMGHALSGTQLGGADNLIRKAQDRFTMFADGGAVKKPVGPSAKERREIRSMIERGKDDAVSALHAMRDALLQTQEESPVTDADTSLARLSDRLTMKDGGDVTRHAHLYDEYRELLSHLSDPRIDDELATQMADRLATIENAFEGQTASPTKTAPISVPDAMKLIHPTVLSAADEEKYRAWLNRIGMTREKGYRLDPTYTGEDYDLRGFFKKYGPADINVAGGQHFTDEFKLPNHQTFSDQSIYAVGPAAKLAGHWVGDRYIPASPTQ